MGRGGHGGLHTIDVVNGHSPPPVMSSNDPIALAGAAKTPHHQDYLTPIRRALRGLHHHHASPRLHLTCQNSPEILEGSVDESEVFAVLLRLGQFARALHVEVEVPVQ